MANPNIPPGPGRPKGLPNKSTQQAREAIGRFVDGNAERLQGWLDAIAEGVPKLDKEGKQIPGQYEVRPNPEKAFTLFQTVVEFHVPKLQRSEVAHEGTIKTEGVLYLGDAPDVAKTSS